MLPTNRLPLTLAAIVSAMAFVLLRPATAHSQAIPPERQEFVRRIVQELSKTGAFAKTGTRVLVTSFWRVDELVPTRCGLCSELEEELASAVASAQRDAVHPRIKDLEPVMKMQGWTVDLMEDPTLQRHAGRMIRAEIVIEGMIGWKERRLELTAFADHLTDGKKLCRVKVKWPKTVELAQALNSPAPPLPFTGLSDPGAPPRRIRTESG